MQLFWDKGYDQTTMDDLIAHTGVARSGLYAAFGDKRELYLRALRLYVAQRNEVSDELLQRSPGGLEAVHTLLERYAADALGRSRRGCLLVNSAILLAPTDPAVTTVVARSWDRITKSLTIALTKAQLDGDVDADREPVALANMVLVVLQGLRVLARTRTRRRLVKDTVEQTMAALTR
jgi:TetR/AcrR family transcriptional regulator, transcriptional repressor for nem operon